MKSIITSIALALIANCTIAQSGFVLPSPTGASDSLQIFIDVNAAGGGLKSMLQTHTEYQDSVYLWSWNPAEPLGGNGQWGASNPNRIMKHEGNLLYSLKILPTDFYGVDAVTFFAKGISCLAKLKNGNAFSEDEVGEAKTPDQNIAIIPKLCDDLYCIFPQQGKHTDYITITYDNAQETNPDLQNLGPDDCYLFVRIQQDTFTGFNYTTPADATLTPVLKMKLVLGENTLFRLTIIPEDLFSSIVPETFDMNILRFYVLKPGFVYLNSPPFVGFNFLDCSE